MMKLSMILRGILMKKIPVTLTVLLLVASCSQFTTNRDKLAELETIANNDGDAYVSCVVGSALNILPSNSIDVATAIQISSQACEADLNLFRISQDEFLSARIIMTKKPLQESINALNERATIEVGEALLSETRAQPTAAIPAALGTAAIVTSEPSTTYSDGNVWSSEQQAYLDCMEDLAHKYAGLDESTTVIADVAQNRCKSQLAGPKAAALEQEGRATVMGIVLDAKLEAPEHQPNQ
jgi:hypothetical protein